MGEVVGTGFGVVGGIKGTELRGFDEIVPCGCRELLAGEGRGERGA